MSYWGLKKSSNSINSTEILKKLFQICDHVAPARSTAYTLYANYPENRCMTLLAVRTVLPRAKFPKRIAMAFLGNPQNRCLNAWYCAGMSPGVQCQFPHAALHVIRDLARLKTLGQNVATFTSSSLLLSIAFRDPVRPYSRPYATARARAPALVTSRRIRCAAPRCSSSNTWLCQACVTSRPRFAHYQHSATV